MASNLRVDQILPSTSTNVAIGTATGTVTLAGTTSGTFSGNLTGSVNSTGVTTVAAGSTSAPSITPTGDSNTGIFFPSADTVCVGTGASEVVRITSGFNVGINSTSPQTKLDVVGGIKGVIVQGTSQVSTAGTSIDFTGIPSWAKRITVMFNGVSTNGSSFPLVQLGTSAGSVNSGYTSTALEIVAGGANITNSTAGFIIRSNTITFTLSGSMIIANVSGNIWTASHTLKADTSRILSGAGDVSLSSILDRIRITTVNGTDTFDAGSINILYEG